MLWIEIILLAILQGIAEFLPISSSGHLAVGQALCDQFGHPLEDKLTLNIVLHVGTLAAIVAFYWKRILKLLTDDRRVIPLLIVGSIPAGIVGLIVKKFFDQYLENPLLAGLMFFVTGGLLLWSTKHESGETTCRELSYGKAFLIGVFQAFAILPGVSRSGSTIVAGLGCGLRRDEAASFSFLLAIPAIGGAGLLELKDYLEKPVSSTPGGALLLGGIVSFVIGLAALAWLVRWVQQGRLHLFAWWVLPMGVIVVAWQLWMMFFSG